MKKFKDFILEYRNSIISLEIDEKLSQILMDINSSISLSILDFNGKVLNEFVKISFNGKNFDIKKKNGSNTQMRITQILDMLDISYSKKEYDEFVEDLKSHYESDDNYTIRFASKNEIKKFYLENNYSSNSNTLGKSCMRYENCQEFFEIYNEKFVDLLVIVDSNEKLLARVLIWTLDNGQKIMDRIYSVNNIYNQIIKRYAKVNDIAYRKYLNHSETVFIHNDNEKIIEAELTLTKVYDRFPYMDTFLFYDGMKIYNHIIDVDELWILQDKTGLKIDIDDMIWSNKEDRYILKSDADFDNVHGWITKKRG